MTTNNDRMLRDIPGALTMVFQRSKWSQRGL
jgi:hypothetical protein